jgi:IS30 family transposase
MVRLSPEEKAEIRRLAAKGLPVREIARQMGRPPTTIVDFIERTQRLTAAVRARSARQLCLAEREEISRGLAEGRSVRVIAARIGRSPSTVCREVVRNGGRGHYRAAAAEDRAWAQGCRPKSAKLAATPVLRAVVEEKLGLQWSPQQISGWLRLAFANRAEMQVSHETIYMSLFVQTRGALRRELAHELRRGRVNRYPRGYSRMNGQGRIRDVVHISERPAEVMHRAVPGHWEGDLVFGSANSCIATLVERHSRFVMLVKIPGRHTSAEVVRALTEHVQALPAELFRSLTWDQGKEMALHQQFTIDTGIQIYFCDPKSPWQRGSNENTNGLLRQYFPKGRSFAGVTQNELDEVAAKLNGRPRQTLGFMTPSQVLEQALR